MHKNAHFPTFSPRWVSNEFKTDKPGFEFSVLPVMSLNYCIYKMRIIISSTSSHCYED